LNGQTEFGQLGAKPLLVGIKNPAQKQLAPGIDNFNVQARELLQKISGWQATPRPEHACHFPRGQIHTNP
jgi:hypothetical protein